MYSDCSVEWMGEIQRSAVATEEATDKYDLNRVLLCVILLPN